MQPGGLALICSATALGSLKLEHDQQVGVDIVRRAVEAPMRWRTTNAGVEGSIVVPKVKDSKDASYGYNAATDTYEDFVKAGVIDPTRAVRSALPTRTPRRSRPCCSPLKPAMGGMY